MAERSPTQRRLIAWFARPPQAAGAYLLYGLLWLLPLDAASSVGAWLLRLVGPALKADRIARENLRRAFPDMGEAEIDGLLPRIWDHLGRVLGEWPHLGRLYRSDDAERIEIVGGEHLARVKQAGGPLICFTGHFGNWELAGATPARFDMPLTVIFRPARNALVNRLFVRSRAAFAGGMLPKGKDAATGALSLLRDGGHLGALIDQKLNEGEAVPFFGHAAMTSPLAARLALRFRCPVIAIRAQRTRGARFRITVYPPIELPDSGDRGRDQRELMLAMNRMLEAWIRDAPEQWFWVHRRWPV